MRNVWWIVGPAMILWTLWLIQYPIFNIIGVEWKADKLGPWGDTFGVLNALFSAGAFTGAFYAILQQQRQIKDAREYQDKINNDARIEQHRQKFETYFLELLKLLREMRDEVTFNDSLSSLNPTASFLAGTEHRGPAAFREAWVALNRSFQSRGALPDRAEAGRIYNDLIQKGFEAQFSPYFRLLYTILNDLNEDNFVSEDYKLKYARLLRSQLTSNELVLAGINGLSPISKDFSVLLTHYRMFKYIPPGPRLRTLRYYYEEEAFSSRD
jgi:hypothetical protein